LLRFGKRIYNYGIPEFLKNFRAQDLGLREEGWVL